MDLKLNQKIQEWLAQDKAQRDIAAGALMLLQLSSNQILYRNIIRNPRKYADMVEYQLKKYLDFRLKQLTHEQVEQMQKQVDAIVEEQLSVSTEAAEFKKGKREDHDQLPDEIQARYVENLSILQQMRELHLKLRSLSLEDATCPDSERYPFLKELIKLDKQLHENWDIYDHYVLQQSSTTTATKSAKTSASTKKAKSTGNKKVKK